MYVSLPGVTIASTPHSVLLYNLLFMTLAYVIILRTPNSGATVAPSLVLALSTTVCVGGVNTTQPWSGLVLSD